MINFKGHGVLRFEDKEIPFENRVNDAFLSAAKHFIDVQGFNGGGAPNELRDTRAISFALLSNPPDVTMSNLYNRIADIPISAFSVISATPLKTTLRAGGTTLTAGTVRSAGFNVACVEPPPTGNIPLMNAPIRRVNLSVTALPSVPVTGTWTFVPAANALYHYSLDHADVMKIPFNPTTGVFGAPIVFTGVFPRHSISSFGFPTTDGHSKFFRVLGTSFSPTHFTVFNCLTDTASTIAFSTPIVNMAIGEEPICWDSFLNLWIINVNFGGTTATAVDISTGQVINIPKVPDSSGTVRVINKDYRIQHSSLSPPYGPATTLARVASGPEPSFNVTILEDAIRKRFRFLDNKRWSMIGLFNSTSPSLFNMTYLREPDTSMTIFAIPPQTLPNNTPFTVDYTFEIIDTR